MNITYTPADAFEVDESSIKIKQYPDSVVSYMYGNNLYLSKSNGLSTPTKAVNVTVTDETSYPYVRVRADKTATGGELVFHKTNFKELVNAGCIRFSVKKADCECDYAYQDFSDFQGLSAGTYSFVIKADTNSVHAEDTITFTLTADTTDVNKVEAAINEVLTNNIQTVFEYKAAVVNNNLRIRTKYEVGMATLPHIEITSGILLTKFTAGTASYFSAPDNDTVVLSLKNDTGSEKNQIIFLHKTDGYLYLIMSDQDDAYVLTKKLCAWTWTNEEFCEFELNFDSSTGIFLTDGKVVSMFEMVGVSPTNPSDVENIVRDNPQTYLNFVGTYNDIQGDAYDYNQVVIFNKKQHCSSYTPTDLKEYDGTAYADFNYGQMTAYDDKSLELEGEGQFMFYMMDGTDIMVSSDSISDFKQKVKELDYDSLSTLSFETTGKLIFRVVFKQKSSVLTKLEFDPGTSVYDPSEPESFYELYEWVRHQLGYPQVQCELTDEQIYENLCHAMVVYQTYRNPRSILQIEDIPGVVDDEADAANLRRGYSAKEGTYFILPANIADDTIYEIFLTPKYSCAFFGGTDFVNNILAQTFFNKASDISSNAADYYIYRSSLEDVGNILGTKFSWRIYNHHLYITPYTATLDNYRIGIKYKAPLSIEEIKNDWLIKDLTLGYSMMQLSIIRGTYSNGIQVGDITLQLNSEALRTRGKELIDSTIDTMRKQQAPLFPIFS